MPLIMELWQQILAPDQDILSGWRYFSMKIG